jgi:transposase
MGKPKRKFEAEFKAEAVRLARSPGRSVADVARSLGIHVNTLQTWLKDLPGDGSQASRRSHRIAESEAVRRLVSTDEINEARPITSRSKPPRASRGTRSSCCRLRGVRGCDARGIARAPHIGRREPPCARLAAPKLDISYLAEHPQANLR